MSTTREQDLAHWFAGWTGLPEPQLAPVAGDASFRRYFRVATGERALILCDSPPDTEKNPEFVRISRAFASAGVRVPAIVQYDESRGFFALEDLGDQLLLPQLNDESVDRFYRQALTLLKNIALADPESMQLPAYDRETLSREMRLFPEWFCEKLLNLAATPASRDVFAAAENLLCEAALGQRKVVVHRDFHSRNLMLLSDGSLATIDYQDAVLGPVTYDLVSLLRDCYVRWEPARVREWMRSYHEALRLDGVELPEIAQFQCDFDWMGLQRHIKVLGIFSRLYLRDAKPAYLGDLPLVLQYVQEVLAAYPREPALSDLAQWMNDELLPAAQRQPWFGGA